MKKFILGFIIGSLLFSGITVLAIHVYHANEISYSPKNTNWNVSNVKSALDSLDTDFTNYQVGMINMLRSKGINVSDNADFNEISDALTRAANSVLPVKSIDDFTAIKTFSGQSGSFTVDCTNIAGYESLTANNFILKITSVYGGKPGNAGNDSNFATAYPSLSYNASTGVLTVSGLSARNGWGGVWSMSGVVYFIGKSS